MSGEFWCHPQFDFEPPPRASDVDCHKLGPYPYQEVVRARSTLIHTVKMENSLFWRNIKAKCGILPNGQRLRQDYGPHVWLPQEIPDSWHAPISLVHVIEDDQKEPGQKVRKNATLTASSIMQGGNTGSNTSSPVICIDGGLEEENDSTHSSASQQSASSLSVGSSRRGSNFSEVIITEANLTSLFESTGSDLFNTNSKLDIANANWSENGEVVLLDDHIDEEINEKNEDKSGGMSGAERVNGKTYETFDLRTGSDCLNANDGQAQNRNSNINRQQSDVSVSDGEKFVTMYKCDICSLSFHTTGEAQLHLNSFLHYSASSYLGKKGAYNKLTPVYTQSLCAVKCRQGLYNKMVPVCPVCHQVFPDIASCSDHTRESHGQYGSYMLRGVRRKKTLSIPLDAGKCVCGVTFPLKVIEFHWLKTNHMPVNVPTRVPTEMSFFVCSLCSQEFYSFLKCRDHVHSMHRDAHSDFSITMYTLEPAASPLTLLPFPPGTERGSHKNGVDSDSNLAATVNGQKRKAQVFEDSVKRLHTEKLC